MNILRALRAGLRSVRGPSGSLVEQLPEVNAFVEVAVGGSGRRESVSVNGVDAADIITRRPSGLAVGEPADFLYTNAIGRFRFSTVCRKIEGDDAHFALPESIKTLASFRYRRGAERVSWVVPVEWRYAPDGAGYGRYLAGSMIDLSRTGASLVVGRALKAGTQVEVRFALNPKYDPFVELCEVVRSAKIERSEKNAAGIRFIEIDPSDERTLLDILHERQTVRRNRGVV
jgi:hypothetical protein